jgi:hypothetical protein
MSIYDELRKHCGETSAEQKLRILRRELLRPILTVQTASALLKQIDAEVVKGLPENISPDEFDRVINWLAEAGGDLKEILDALTLECTDTPAHQVE